MDKTTNTTVDLKAGTKLSFSTQAGDFEDRFILKITIFKVLKKLHYLKACLTYYAFNGILNIELLSDNWNGKQGDVKLTDLTGRAIQE